MTASPLNNIFPLTEKHDFYKNKMLSATSKEKHDIACELGGACCYAMHVFMNSSGKHSKVPQLMKALDKVARSVVFASDGIQDGYRLSDYWLHTLFAQILLKESESNDKRDQALTNLKQLFHNIGWNYKEATEPMYDNTKTLMSIEFARKYDDEGEIEQKGVLKIVLYPTAKMPVGSTWMSSTGGKYTYLGNMEFEPVEMNSRGLYTPVKLTEYQIRNWCIL